MEKREAALVFGEVADEYDRARPPYPVALIDDVLDFSRVAAGDRRALDVGAGTGRATVAFAARGVPIVAVEPDDAMADVLARRVEQLPGVQIVRSSFEGVSPRRALRAAIQCRGVALDGPRVQLVVGGRGAW